VIPEPHDVVRRSLKVEYDDPNTPNDTISIPLEVHTVEGMSAPQDTKVTLTLTHIDDGNNESEPTVFEFTAKDDVPPPAPGEFGVIVEGENIGVTPGPPPEEPPPVDAEPLDPTDVDPDEPEAPEDTPEEPPEDAPVSDEAPTDEEPADDTPPVTEP
jgi:hypothetical protein